MKGGSPVRFVLSLFYMCAIQMTPVCVVTSDCGLFLVCLCVSSGFDSTSPTFVRSRASQAVGSDSRLVQKNGIGPPGSGERQPACTKKRNRAPIYGGRDCVDTICADFCNSLTSFRLCLGPKKKVLLQCRCNY